MERDPILFRLRGPILKAEHAHLDTLRCAVTTASAHREIHDKQSQRHILIYFGERLSREQIVRIAIGQVARNVRYVVCLSSFPLLSRLLFSCPCRNPRLVGEFPYFREFVDGNGRIDGNLQG